PVVTDIDFESTPLMLVTMSGPPGFDDAALKQIAEEVQEDLEGIPGVANTQVFGGREREIHVDVNPDLLAQHNFTIEDIVRAVRAFHATLPGGAQDTGEFDFQIRNATRLRGVSDIEQIILRQEQGRVIRVSDVAEVKDTHRRLVNIAHLDGRDCAAVVVNKESDINSLAAAQAVKAKVESLRNVYPHIRFATTRDTSEEISVMFRVLGSSFAFGGMLVLIILGWSMGLRISLLVLMAAPISTAVGLIFLYSMDVPISNMVIFSFILALGMVVDGAIIVAENIHRHLERGEDPIEAAKIGISEVGMPVIIADLTTIAAYLPMLLVPGIMGDFMSVMPKVVSVALAGSMLVDHFLLPVVAAYVFRRRHVTADEHEVFQTIAASAAVAPAADSNEDEKTASPRRAARINPHVGLVTRFYASTLRWALNNGWAIIASSGLALVLAWALLMQIGFDFFPASDRGQFTVKVELPLGTSIRQTALAAQAVAQSFAGLEVNGEQVVVNSVSAIGSSEGLASRLETDPAVGPEFGTVMVQLSSPLDRKTHEDVIIRDHIRPALEK
ncbi:MAG: efflux RND transporter permease subunit, partial [Planctomycetales bacterium]|nr:efflux RND transporter permease subunit [Planctomycetales bacterium]